MELENITITATIESEPVMVVLDSDQRKMLPDLIAACDKSGACRVARLDPKEYTLSRIPFLSGILENIPSVNDDEYENQTPIR